MNFEENPKIANYAFIGVKIRKSSESCECKALLSRRRARYIKPARAGASFIRLLAFDRKASCPAEAREEKDWEREAPSVTERFSVTTSRASRSQPSVVWREEVVWNVSPAWSTKRPEESWRCFWRMWSEMPSPTPSTPRERPSPPWMWSTLWRDRDVPFTDSVDKKLSNHHSHPALFRATHVFPRVSLDSRFVSKKSFFFLVFTVLEWCYDVFRESWTLWKQKPVECSPKNRERSLCAVYSGWCSLNDGTNKETNKVTNKSYLLKYRVQIN